jgi:uncharacterized membrane protein YkoI
MNMTAKTRAGIIAGVATGALALAALAGTAVANAADSTPSPSTSQSADAKPDRQHTPEEPLTGDPAAKVKAAVEAKYPGATIDRMEKDSDGASVYEAHITKADGTHVTVMLDASYAITGEEAFGGKGAKGGRGGMGGHARGDHGAAHTPEEALTGDPAAKVKAAVEAKYPGATIDRMEKDSDGASVYEAHITKADGTHVTVMLDASYAITGEDAFGGKGGKGGSTASPTAA